MEQTIRLLFARRIWIAFPFGCHRLQYFQYIFDNGHERLVVMITSITSCTIFCFKIRLLLL